MAALSLTYLADQLITLRRSAEQATAAAPVAEGLALDRCTSIMGSAAIAGLVATARLR